MSHTYEFHRLFELHGTLADAVRSAHLMVEQEQQTRRDAIEAMRKAVGASKVRLQETGHEGERLYVLAFEFEGEPDRDIWRPAKLIRGAWWPKARGEGALVREMLEKLPKVRGHWIAFEALWNACPEDRKPERYAEPVNMLVPSSRYPGMCTTKVVNNQVFLYVTKHSNWQAPELDDLQEVPGWVIEKARWEEMQAA